MQFDTMDILKVISTDDVEGFKGMLSTGLPLDHRMYLSQWDEQGATLLDVAKHPSSSKRIAAYILEIDTDKRLGDSVFRTAMRHPAMVPELIHRGYDVKSDLAQKLVADLIGTTVHGADEKMLEMRFASVEALIKAGTPLDEFLNGSIKPEHESMLARFVLRDDTNRYLKLFDDVGIDVKRIKIEGMPLTHYLTKALLLSMGDDHFYADVCESDTSIKQDFTAEIESTRRYVTKVLTRWVEAGADINALDGGANTPLHRAVSTEYMLKEDVAYMVKALLALEADPGRVNKAGKTAVDLARENGYDDAIDLLAGEQKTAAKRHRP